MEHLSIETWDADEVEAILRKQYTAQIGSPGATVGLQVTQDSLDTVFLSRVRYFMDADFTVDEPMSR